MRSRQAIAAEILHFERLLRELRHEYALARLTPRNTAIWADHEAGLAIAEIAVKHRVTYAVVNNVLARERIARQEGRIRERLAGSQHEGVAP